MVWREGLVGCSPHYLDRSLLSSFGLVVDTSSGGTSLVLKVTREWLPLPPRSTPASFLRWEAAICGWLPAGGTVGKWSCKAEGGRHIVGIPLQRGLT